MGNNRKILLVGVLPYAIFALHFVMAPGVIGALFCYPIAIVLMPAAVLWHILGLCILAETKTRAAWYFAAIVFQTPVLVMVTIGPLLMITFTSEYSFWAPGAR
jgi:hypothetical protein